MIITRKGRIATVRREVSSFVAASAAKVIQDGKCGKGKISDEKGREAAKGSARKYYRGRSTWLWTGFEA